MTYYTNYATSRAVVRWSSHMVQGCLKLCTVVLMIRKFYMHVYVGDDSSVSGYCCKEKIHQC